METLGLAPWAAKLAESAYQRLNPVCSAPGTGPANVPMRRDSLWSRLPSAAPAGFQVR